jgi:mono/diheme cytochrome c family protein
MNRIYIRLTPLLACLGLLACSGRNFSIDSSAPGKENAGVSLTLKPKQNSPAAATEINTDPIKGQAAPTDPHAAEIKKGKLLFVKATCWGCHPRGENSLHPDKPLQGPAFEKKYKTDQSIVDFVRAISRGKTF